MKGQFLFNVLPYAAASSLLLGTALRFAVARRGTRLDDRLERAREIYGGGKLWRIGLALVVAAHLLALAIPDKVVIWSQVPWRLYLLEISGLLVGLFVLISWSAAMGRHLAQAEGTRAAAVADAAFLASALVAIFCGLLTALFYRWGSRWSAATLMPYLASLPSGEPSSAYVVQLPFVVQLHVAAGFVALALLPFSGVGAFVIAAADRALGWVARPFAVGGRWAEAWMRRRNPAAWIWPEED